MLVCVTWLSIAGKKHKNTIFTGDYYYVRVIGNLFLGQGEEYERGFFLCKAL